MDLGLESISSNFSPASNFAALPVAGAVTQVGSVHGGGGGRGFASMLAAAQQELSTPATAASAIVSEASSAGSTPGAEAASGVNLKAAINLPLRKPASAVGGAGSTNNFADAPVAVAANPVALALPVQVSLVPGVVVSSAANSTALPSIADGLSTGTERALPAGQQFSSAFTGSGGAIVFASGVLPQNIFPPTQNQIPSSDQESSAVVLPAAVDSGASAVASNAVQASQWNSSEAQPLSTEPAVVAANTTPSVFSFTSRPASSDTVWNVVPQIQGSGIPANGAAGAQTTTQAFGAADAATPTALNVPSAPILMASTFPAADSSDGAQELSNGNLPGTRENSLPANSLPAVTANSVATSSSSLPADIGSLLSGGVSTTTTAALTPLNSAIPLLGQIPLGQTLPRPVAAQAGAKAGAGVTGASSVRTVGASSPTTSATASETAAGATSPLASVSPFAVYFSSPGPGTESAASTLPKMILPANTASHGSSIAVGTATAANSLSAGLQSNAIAPVAPPPIASQANTNNKDLPAGITSAGATAQAATLHADSSSAAPAAAVAVAQASAGAPAAAVTSVPASVMAAQSLPANSQLPGQPAGTSSGNAAPTLPPLPPATPAAVPVPGPVQMAQMVDRAGQAEMRVGMNTSAFGNVEVRTVVHASGVGLTIGSEKGDLRGLLTNDMPAISNSLQQQNLRLNNVSFMQGFASGNSGGGGGDSQQQRSFVPASTAANFSSPEAIPDEASGIVSTGGGWVGGGSSLSILA